MARIKPTTNWTNRNKPTSNWGERTGFLLMEDGFYLLQENGSRIVLFGKGSDNWTERIIPTTVWV